MLASRNIPSVGLCTVIKLPIPKDISLRNHVASKIKNLISEKERLRKEQKLIREKIQKSY